MSRPNLAIVQQRGATSGSEGLSNLPAQPTPIIGREAEIDSLVARLRQPDLRLVTLVGPGGVGKTRLAVQVAVDLLQQFNDGVWFVGLAPIVDPSLVIPTIAQTLDLHAPPGQPILTVLKEHLRSKHTLLLLDNFEQIMPAGSALAELLAACPNLKLLVTSRSALHLRGEQEFPVPPLTLPNLKNKRLPDPEALQQYSAVALFAQRASSVKPDFTINSANAEAVVEICARLDGLPLAIELVAARVKLLQPQAILPRLQHGLHLLTDGAHDLPVRQQTLRSAIEWSYDLLTEEEQMLFRRLAVFVGGCTLEAAEVVCGLVANGSVAVDGRSATGDALRLDVLNGIGSLINKSLLRQAESGDGGEEEEQGEQRFTMLETIREYAWEQLEAVGIADVMRGRHAAYFVAMAEETEPLLTGAAQKESLDKLEREHDNFRAALKWCRTSENGSEHGLRLAGALGRFWSSRDYLGEGREWLDEVLAKPGASAHTTLRTRALYVAAIIADNQGDYNAVRAFCRESLTIKRELLEKSNMASSYILLAKAASNEGHYDEAQSLLQEGLAVAREASDSYGLAHCLNGLGELERLQDDYVTAREHYTECLALFRQMENANGIGFSLHNLAHVYVHEGKPAQAAALLDEGLALYKKLGNRLGIAMCVSAMSGVAIGYGQPLRAAKLLGAAQALLEFIGALLDPADLMEYKRNEEAARKQLREGAFLASWMEGRAMTPEQVASIRDMSEHNREPAASLTETDRAAAARQPAQKHLPQASNDGLSARELDVLRLIGQGLSDANVAAQLCLSPHTVRAHLRSIYSKIGVTSRSAATRYAAENNIK
ncbi:MAG: tetratricopeptide repeat protein [Chloroflexota bacterium]